MIDTNTMEQIRTRLLDELAAVNKQLEDYGAGTEGEGTNFHADEGFADSAQVTAERSEMLSLIDQHQQLRTDITAALARIDAGTYGTCDRCGRDIPAERLEAVPTTALCVDCKQSTSSA